MCFVNQLHCCPNSRGPLGDIFRRVAVSYLSNPAGTDCALSAGNYLRLGEPGDLPLPPVFREPKQAKLISNHINCKINTLGSLFL